MRASNAGKQAIDEYYNVDEHLAHVLDDLPQNFEFRVGMVFPSELEAYHTYVAYALGKGFGVRKDKTCRNAKGEITRRTFVCNCEGYPPFTPAHEQKKYERLEERCGCLARIKFKVENGAFEVLEYNSDHNHAFIPENKKHLIRCGRMVSDPCKGVLANMAKAGMGGTKAHKVSANEAEEENDFGLIMRKRQNVLQSRSNTIGGGDRQSLRSSTISAGDWLSHRSNTISGADSQSLLNHFKSKQMQNPMFFYAVQVNGEGRLTNFFWRDSLSKVEYDCFRDVVLFDTTYRTHKYNMVCASFVGVNHHWKNVLFGCALLLDETIDSFVWLFETVLEAMGNKVPKIIFTGQDQAISNAIQKVLPNTQHRLCVWHIAKNAAQNIPYLFGKPEFKDKYFFKLLHGCETEQEFESTWKKMEEKWGTSDNKWLQGLYELRFKWSAAFSRDIFSFDIRSLQRSEGAYNVFQQISANTMDLIKFVHCYEEEVKRMREVEVQDDCNSQDKPKLFVRNNKILTHAASVYTHAIFYKFQDEFLQSMSEWVLNTSSVGTVHNYTLACQDGQRHHVRFNSNDCAITCSCKLFESKGWLCRHALCVLNANITISEIPSAYVLRRWTKGAKVEVMQSDCLWGPENLSQYNHFGKLMLKALMVIALAAENEDTFKIALGHLETLMDEIRKQKSARVCADDDNQPAQPLENHNMPFTSLLSQGSSSSYQYPTSNVPSDFEGLEDCLSQDGL